MRRITVVEDGNNIVDTTNGPVRFSQWIEEEVARMNEVTPGYAKSHWDAEGICIMGNTDLIKDELIDVKDYSKYHYDKN